MSALLRRLRGLPRWLLAAGRRGRHALRRSLRLRVVGTTVLLGLAVVSLIGVYLADQISERLFESRRDQVLEEARAGMARAQQSLDNADPARDLRLVAEDLRAELEDVSTPGRERDVLLLRPPGNDSPAAIGNVFSAGVVPSVVPEELRAAVREGGPQRWQSIGVPQIGGEVRPAIAVGELVEVPRAGAYELYFVFDLSTEQATLDAVQNVLVLGGVALVLLVGGVAYVVTRQVVAPVRQAAAVAERLAAGQLHERMPERGEDDLARLAHSFNEMAASLGQQIEAMEELSRLQRRFVSDVSHELRTPLTTIRMAGEVLHEARGEFDPAVARSAELLATQIDRFEALLADLLEISRFDAGAAALDVEALDVRGIVDRVVELAAPLAERRGTRLQVSVPPTPCMAEVDSRRVERIVRNLVLNAVEHGEGRPVEVTLAADADAVAVAVRDHGVGLRPEDVQRVFDRFWRGDPARARTTGGTGLGLAISAEDANLHGGRLEVDGRPGLGAVFRLTLPRRAGSPLGPDSPLPLGRWPERARSGPESSPGPRAGDPAPAPGGTRA
ncbi:HAMP domain-containing histidine kinase [Kineosporiaceae bacterium SCSIO 59966]|nr:HAMP domain-containing histidine kinase [Kineosporiaceae bacterium SCSIO 59966]